MNKLIPLLVFSVLLLVPAGAQNAFAGFNDGAIGDTVFLDLDDDGVQDAGEPGIAGVTVNLSGAATDSQSTDANGNYLFTGLTPGDYSVTTDAMTAPAGTEPGNNCPDTFTVNLADQAFLDSDFCYIPSPGQIGDTVFLDLDDDGIQDAGEPGIADVLVVLSGAANDIQLTDANGNYLFTGIPAGDYSVNVDEAGSILALDGTQQGNNCPDTFVLSLNPGESFLDSDFCYIPSPGQIGDTVFLDSNDNGIQDGGEPGLAGVTVNLSGAATDSQSTDANGNYLFTGLAPGTYSVSTDAMTAPAGTEPGNNCPDTFTIGLNPGQGFLDADFCFTSQGAIGDTVFLDLDDDGVQDAGEPGIAGVTVNLSGAATASQSTDANGKYLFTGLSPGDYSVTTDAMTAPGTLPGNNCPDSFSIAITTGATFLDGDFCFVPTVINPNPVGGTFISIEQTSLILAGTQLTAAWMIPAIVSAIGIGLVLVRKSENS